MIDADDDGDVHHEYTNSDAACGNICEAMSDEDKIILGVAAVGVLCIRGAILFGNLHETVFRMSGV